MNGKQKESLFMNEHHKERVMIEIEKSGNTRRVFTRTVPNSVDVQTFTGDLISEYTDLMNTEPEKSIVFHDDVTGTVFICKRSEIKSIEINRK